MGRIDDRPLTPSDLLEWCEKAQRRNPAAFSRNGRPITPTMVLDDLQRVGRIYTYPEFCNLIRAIRSGVPRSFSTAVGAVLEEAQKELG